MRTVRARAACAKRRLECLAERPAARVLCPFGVMTERVKEPRRAAEVVVVHLEAAAGRCRGSAELCMEAKEELCRFSRVRLQTTFQDVLVAMCALMHEKG